MLLSCALLLLLDRTLGTSFYLSGCSRWGTLDNMGVRRSIFQHLFWFLGHPGVHRAAAGAGHHLRGDRHQRAQAHLRLPRDDRFDPGDRLPELHRVGPPMFITGRTVSSVVFVFTTLLIAIPRR